MARRKGPSLTRQQVIDAAIRCVEADGPQGLGVSRVARELGIKPPSLYNHIDTGGLPSALLIEGSRRLVAALKPTVRGVVAPYAQLRALAMGMRQWAQANPGLYATMARVEPDNEHPEFAPLMVDLFDLFTRPLGQLGIEGSDAIHAIRCLRAAVHGFVLLENSGQFQLSEGSADSYRWLIDTILRGLHGGADSQLQGTP